jgi:hypothetical protein
MAERLRRLEWLFQRNSIYFITANTQGRTMILATPTLHEALQGFADRDPTVAHRSGRIS